MSTNNHPAPALVVFDMAGTTVEDTGLVQRSFLAADEHAGLSTDAQDRERMMQYVHDTMGQSKIVVFRHLSRGNEEQAQTANKAFERSYAQLVEDGNCSPIPGAVDVMSALRDQGVKVALTTGFAFETQQAILDALGWQGLADVVLCPGDGIRGRPYPDMALTALLRTATDSVQQMVVVGDTSSDITTGVRAGARASVGVLTGAHGADQLRAAGATHVLDSVADLPGLLTELHAGAFSAV
ncbi:phosphonatase-like hydrolase [Antrihabitans cavernicola]|uniref:Phosphonatase-like hydrolase n=1 Tax=Antrihabitans cavernicola TaxID=2495913 RepID=A0A5A7SE93_9NOCA|nr:phosphonatase-like hydrolase [Spelaeibacter cavernicola]KAA0023017.1 phosphonatase-like hydrolase [Spelaeibacter cavernicola]